MTQAATMLVLSVSAMVLLLQSGNAQDYNCSSTYNRVPDNRDLAVDCRISEIILELNLCTALWAGFNYTDLALNSGHNNSLCKGTVDSTRDPPVIRYQLPVNDSSGNPCRQSLQIVDEPPQAGIFSSFSSIQSIIVTGYIDTPMSSYGFISYGTDLYYQFSCRYPLEYFLIPDPVISSSVSLATNHNNGSFGNTLSMGVFNDSSYIYGLEIPQNGLPLRSSVYVEVKATNLSNNFHLLLDHCFATPSPLNGSIVNNHNFFIGCDVNQKTSVIQNGISQSSRFSFETFRFVEHRDKARSSLYLHCIVRLCEPSKCQEILNTCPTLRKKRAVEPFGKPSSNSATVSLGPIYTASEEEGHSAPLSDTAGNSAPSSSGMGGVLQPPGSKTSIYFALFTAVGIIMSTLN